MAYDLKKVKALLEVDLALRKKRQREEHSSFSYLKALINWADEMEDRVAKLEKIFGETL